MNHETNEHRLVAPSRVRPRDGEHPQGPRARPRRRLRLEAAREVVLDGRARRARREHSRLADARRSSATRSTSAPAASRPSSRSPRPRGSPRAVRRGGRGGARRARRHERRGVRGRLVPSREREALFTMPRAAVVRSFVMNHLIHHRAQLCVYLRLRDVPVPGALRAVGGRPGLRARTEGRTGGRAGGSRRPGPDLAEERGAREPGACGEGAAGEVRHVLHSARRVDRPVLGDERPLESLRVLEEGAPPLDSEEERGARVAPRGVGRGRDDGCGRDPREGQPVRASRMWW